jgi:hypothetical protein
MWILDLNTTLHCNFFSDFIPPVPWSYTHDTTIEVSGPCVSVYNSQLLQKVEWNYPQSVNNVLTLIRNVAAQYYSVRRLPGLPRAIVKTVAKQSDVSPAGHGS